MVKSFPAGRARSAASSFKNTALLPNLITLGNAVCGFAALSLIARVDLVEGELAHLENLGRAAWLIVLGMFFDVFDGRVARMTGTTSSLGAQLDSLADLVTFGVAPAGLMVTLSRTALQPEPWGKVVWFFGLAYFLGAILRLARFNVEHEESDEVTLCFKGMPTPAAAGCVSGLVIFYFYLGAWKSWELRSFAETAPQWVPVAQQWIARSLPFFAFLCGYAMVSNRLFYPHVASQLVERRQSFDALAYLVFGSVLAVAMIEPFLAAVFLGYLLWTPLRFLMGRRLPPVVVAPAATAAPASTAAQHTVPAAKVPAIDGLTDDEDEADGR